MSQKVLFKDECTLIIEVHMGCCYSMGYCYETINTINLRISSSFLWEVSSCSQNYGLLKYDDELTKAERCLIYALHWQI